MSWTNDRNLAKPTSLRRRIRTTARAPTSPSRPGRNQRPPPGPVSAAGDRRESLAQLAQPSGRARNQPRAGRIAFQDPALRPDARPSWVGEPQQVDHRAAADPAALGRQPRKAGGGDQWIVRTARQPRGEIQVVGVNPLAARPGLVTPARHFGSLD
jgi:hypothetical protein